MSRQASSGFQCHLSTLLRLPPASQLAMAGAASAKRFLRACAQFASDIGDLAVRTKNALKAVQQAVESDFGVDAPEPKGRTASEKRLMRQVRHRTRQLATLRRTLALVRGEKDSGHIHTETFVRVGLTGATVNPRKLRELLEDDGGKAPMSHVYIDRTRGAFAEMIKGESGKLVEAMVLADPGCADLLDPHPRRGFPPVSEFRR